jgi:hypothetical protein
MDFYYHLVSTLLNNINLTTPFIHNDNVIPLNSINIKVLQTYAFNNYDLIDLLTMVHVHVSILIHKSYAFRASPIEIDNYTKTYLHSVEQVIKLINRDVLKLRNIF